MNAFYEKSIKSGTTTLSEDESKHCAQVLRHQVGDHIELVDGLGARYEAELTSISKRACEFNVLNEHSVNTKPFSIHLAIAPTKNMDRLEWMIEKVCEIGVDQVSFILTENSERRKLRIDRLEKKTISALKQSKNPFKTQLNELVKFSSFITNVESSEKWIAHVSEHPHLSDEARANKDVCILIGPEGDFSEDEVQLAISAGFQPISLGQSTLRTETAGFAACHLINVINKY